MVVALSIYDSVLSLPLLPVVIPSLGTRGLPNVDDEQVYEMSPDVDVDVSVQPSGHFSDVGGNGPALLPWSMSNPIVASEIIRTIVAIVRTIM
jgi:hypothetical protein